MKADYFKILFMTVLVIPLVMQLAGCATFVAGGAVGSASVVYVNGQLSDIIDAPVPNVYEASISTLKELGLSIIEDRHDTLSARIKSKFADGEDVWVAIESITTMSSKV